MIKKKNFWEKKLSSSDKIQIYEETGVKYSYSANKSNLQSLLLLSCFSRSSIQPLRNFSQEHKEDIMLVPKKFTNKRCQE